MRHMIDLHTHSIASPDGSLTKEMYRRMLRSGDLDVVAITDHNTIEIAQELHQELGEEIIVGEEITTTHGEIIGLYLKKTVPAGLSPAATVSRIKAQDGLVYIPHPFETVRSGISLATLEQIINEVDIIEIGNGRAVFQNCSELAKEWAIRYQKAGAASSDSHGVKGWGRTYNVVPAFPARHTLVELLHASTYEVAWPGPIGLLYPKMNRVRKKFGFANKEKSIESSL